MINYRKGKKRIKVDNLGSLYLDLDKIKEIKTTIYIGGQMEHRCHLIEQSGFTNDPGHNMFCGSWFYDYPIFTGEKSAMNAHSFCNNFLKSLEEADLGNVTIVTESFGGLIGALATKSDRVDQVIAIHPPIIGTPLAEISAYKSKKNLLTNYQKLLTKIISLITNPRYGFEQDNLKGVNLNEVDLNKLLVVGSYLDLEHEPLKFLLDIYDIILKYTGFRSDGVVIFEPSEFDRLGINYIQEEQHNNHFVAGSPENINNAKKLIK